MEATKRISIAGARSSRLTSIKACLEEDLLPECFEKTDQLGDFGATERMMLKVWALYKKPDGYDAKKAVIVGAGNSAEDVIVELSEIAKQVYLSVRSGCWIIPRTSPGGKQLDASLFRRWWNLISFYTPYKLLRYIVDTFVGKETVHSSYCLRCKRSILEQRSTINYELQHVIQSGAVIMKGNIRKFTENRVVF
ncbi:flavin-containing monooxygenase 5-like [Tachypleus tridentatus]|uniref:flavin-containing monooxygenase 5-like n=1 Tax=Tachypleus tridentatus TaxID=6853 RepID=UPI003FD5C1C2